MISSPKKIRFDEENSISINDNMLNDSESEQIYPIDYSIRSLNSREMNGENKEDISDAKKENGEKCDYLIRPPSIEDYNNFININTRKVHYYSDFNDTTCSEIIWLNENTGIRNIAHIQEMCCNKDNPGMINLKAAVNNSDSDDESDRLIIDIPDSDIENDSDVEDDPVIINNSDDERDHIIIDMPDLDIENDSDVQDDPVIINNLDDEPGHLIIDMPESDIENDSDVEDDRAILNDSDDERDRVIIDIPESDIENDSDVEDDRAFLNISSSDDEINADSGTESANDENHNRIRYIRDVESDSDEESDISGAEDENDRVRRR